MAQASLQYEFPLGIKLKVNAAVDGEDNFVREYLPQTNVVDESGRRPANLNALNFVYDQARNGPVSRRETEMDFDLTLITTLGYDNVFGNHTVSGLLGYSQESFDFENVGLSVTDFPINGLTDLNVFGAINSSELGGKGFFGGTTENRLMSFFGRAGYDFSKKYFADLTFRYDGSSRFARGNRFGFFPSVALGWRLDNESFFNIDAIDIFKLRFSWGELGEPKHRE